MENNDTVKELLKEYEKKRLNAITEAENKKQVLYNKCPEFLEIEDKLHALGISTAKAILSNNDSSYLSNLKAEIEKLKAEQVNILKKLNMDETHLQPNFECKVCNDTGFITQNYQTTMCTCLKQKLLNIEYNKCNISNLDRENFNNFNLNHYSDEVNKEKYNSNISPKDNIKIIRQLCENFINDFDNPNSKNLLFTGNTGLGKTFLSNCIANELLKSGKTVLYQTAPVMLDSIIDYRFGKKNIQNICDYIYSVDLLIIDDLGTETINSMKFTELFNIINTRLLNSSNKVTKTIISTNLNMKNLYQTYDERIVSRFVGYYNICRFFGEDIRFKQEIT